MNTLLITADTLRADHLSGYGYWRPTSPRLDRLAAEGVRFENFIGQCAHTLPSFTSMMTGLTPFQTGVVATLHCVPDTPSGRLSDHTPVLAELLARHGVHTYAVDNLMAFACHPSWFVRGFGEYLNPNPESFVTRCTAPMVNRVLLPLLERVREPFFVWAHYWDPHRPYNQPDEYLAPFDSTDGEAHVQTTADGRQYIPRWGTLEGLDAGSWANGAMPDRDRVQGARAMIDAYDGEILYLDRHLDEVFAKMEALGLYDDTCIVVTADHGETMADQVTHFCHVQALDACTRVPLIVKPARGTAAAPRVASELATHTDIPATVLDLLGVDAEVQMEGRSLRPVLDGSGEWGRDHVVSTGLYLMEDRTWKSVEVAVRTERWRLRRLSPMDDYPVEGLKYSRLWEVIAKLYESEPRHALFDTANDRDELTDVAAAHPDRVEELSSLLRPALESPYVYRGA